MRSLKFLLALAAVCLVSVSASAQCPGGVCRPASGYSVLQPTYDFPATVAPSYPVAPTVVYSTGAFQAAPAACQSGCQQGQQQYLFPRLHNLFHRGR